MKSAIKVPFELTDARRSGLRAVLALLPIPSNSVTVDVGAGGFAGQTTTEPILEIICGKVVCIETDTNLSMALGAKFGDGIINVCAHYGVAGAGRPHDLVVIDLDFGSIPAIFEQLLDFAIRDGLKPGGYLISLFVYNIEIAYEPVNGLLRVEGREDQAAFLRRYFGTEKVNGAVLQKKFATHAQFEFVALVDKWIGEGRNSVGWVVLRRREESNPPPCTLVAPICQE